MLLFGFGLASGLFERLGGLRLGLAASFLLGLSEGFLGRPAGLVFAALTLLVRPGLGLLGFEARGLDGLLLFLLGALARLLDRLPLLRLGLAPRLFDGFPSLPLGLRLGLFLGALDFGVQSFLKLARRLLARRLLLGNLERGLFLEAALFLLGLLTQLGFLGLALLLVGLEAGLDLGKALALLGFKPGLELGQALLLLGTPARLGLGQAVLELLLALGRRLGRVLFAALGIADPRIESIAPGRQLSGDGRVRGHRGARLAGHQEIEQGDRRGHPIAVGVDAEHPHRQGVGLLIVLRRREGQLIEVQRRQRPR